MSGGALTYTDAQLLKMLELLDRGASRAEIARRMGLTKNAVIGQLHRIGKETEPSKHDGTMPTGWWKAGLRKQEGQLQ